MSSETNFNLKRPDSKCIELIKEYEEDYVSGEKTATAIGKLTGYKREKVKKHFNHEGIFAPTCEVRDRLAKEFHTPLFLFNRRLTHADLR